MLNEKEMLDRWFGFVKEIADGGILIVDTGSTDGTVEYARELGAEVIVDDIIQREGYGPARNHLRDNAARLFPEAQWLLYLDADETIDEEDFHQLRYIKDYLIEQFDVVCLPRIDWMDEEKSAMAKDWRIFPDWQARMARLNSGCRYVRRLHEQITGYKNIYNKLTNPAINHFHRSAGQEKRDFVGKLCAKLHMEDKEYGHTYPEHHKEAHYRELYKKEGL
jgi:glycosyltransferase involved in cell wall biosynthesis